MCMCDYIRKDAASSSMALPLRRLEEDPLLLELLWADISAPLWSQTTRSGGTLVSHSKTTRSPGGATIGWGERTKDTPDVIVTPPKYTSTYNISVAFYLVISSSARVHTQSPTNTIWLLAVKNKQSYIKSDLLIQRVVLQHTSDSSGGQKARDD